MALPFYTCGFVLASAIDFNNQTFVYGKEQKFKVTIRYTLDRRVTGAIIAFI